MAVKFIAETDTLEQFRLEFNDLSANQFGDIEVPINELKEILL